MKARSNKLVTKQGKATCLHVCLDLDEDVLLIAQIYRGVERNTSCILHPDTDKRSVDK